MPGNKWLATHAQETGSRKWILWVQSPELGLTKGCQLISISRHDGSYLKKSQAAVRPKILPIFKLERTVPLGGANLQGAGLLDLQNSANSYMLCGRKWHTHTIVILDGNYHTYSFFLCLQKETEK